MSVCDAIVPSRNEILKDLKFFNMGKNSTQAILQVKFLTLILLKLDMD